LALAGLVLGLAGKLNWLRIKWASVSAGKLNMELGLEAEDLHVLAGKLNRLLVDLGPPPR
jgi:hypothetical protein